MVIKENYEKMLLKKAMLSALPLRDLVREEGDKAIRAYERGCVLRLDQDSIVTPLGIPLPMLNAQYFRDTSGTPLDSGRFDLAVNSPADTTYLCAFQRIVDDYYYLDYTRSEVRDEYIKAYLDTESILKNLERAFNGHILLFSSSDDRHELLYTPEAFGDFATIEDTGIDPNTPAQSFAVVTLNDVEYIYTLSEPVKASDDSVDHTIRAAFLLPIENLTFRQIPRLAAALGISALFFIAAITWMRAVSSLIRRRIITEIQRREYGVTRVRKIIAIIGIIGALAVILMTTFVDALLLLYSTTQHNQALLETMNVVVSQSDQDEALVKAQLEDAYIRYAQRVADLLAANPELCNQEALQEICDVIGADYLMLFDDKGHETLSNAPYVNLTFSGVSAASTYDFRRLLTGVPSIVHEPKVDEATGLNRQLIGVCMHDDNTSDGYGALILARIPGDDVNTMSVDELMHSMTTEDCLCMILDPDSGDILHASDPDYVDENALTLGMPRRALQDNFMDYFRFDGVRWYSCSGLFDDGLYHCASMSSVIYSHLLRNALVFGGLFLVAYALLAVVLLFDFTDRLIDEYGGKVMDDEESLRHAKDSAHDNASERLSLALKELRMIHKRTSPEKQTGFVFRLAGGIILISSLVFLLFRINSQVGTMNPSYILTYVMSDGWERGINLFAFARILLMLASIAAILMVMDLITSLALPHAGKAG